MKQLFLKFAVAGSAIMTFAGSYAFTPRPFLNVIYAIRTGASSFSYTTVKPVPSKSCATDPANVACTISSTATVNFFNTNNSGTFPTASSTPGAPEVIFVHAGSIYK